MSAGASSRLLIEYPEPERSQILDFLFKPHFGAGFQHLKVEVGGDVNSTDGTEPSHMRTRDDENYTRGYEWWLMKEAKRRNPAIVLDCLPWGAPGWIGGGKFYSQDMADYTVIFLQGAKRVHGLDINYCGIWNETAYNVDWIKRLRRTLDAAGLQRVGIVAADEINAWNIVADMEKDAELKNAVAVVGTHYPATKSTALAKTCGKPIWSSEDGPWKGAWEGAGALAKAFNRNYVAGRMTKTVIWSLITSYYDNLPLPGSGPMRANTPWSGHYEVQPAVWAIAHTTQFAEPGWKYLDSGCVMIDGGSVVALASPDGQDYSLIIETMDARRPQTTRFQLAGRAPEKPLHVWRSDAKEQFAAAGDIMLASGIFEITLAPGAIYSLTTTAGQRKGAVASIPASTAFPLPYEDGFERARPGTMPRYFADQGGIFEIARRDDGRGQCIRQVVSTRGIDWGRRTPEPYTMIGSTGWRDYEVACDVRLDKAGYAAVFGRIVRSPPDIQPPEGYWLKADARGTWELKAHTRTLAGGKLVFAAGSWHNLRLRFAGKKITATVDGMELRTIEDTSYPAGMAGLGTGWNTAEFGNFRVR